MRYWIHKFVDEYVMLHKPTSDDEGTILRAEALRYAWSRRRGIYSVGAVSEAMYARSYLYSDFWTPDRVDLERDMDYE